MNKTQTTMTDPELYALCKKWGAEALEARRRFVGLLPEVNVRRLYERRGYSSIYHFTAVLGGVSEHLVNDVLRLEKRFEEMPRLHEALVKGEIGLSKLARIASVVEVRNEVEICEKIKTLSRRAVDVLVKEIKVESESAVKHDGLFERGNEAKSLAGQNHDFELLNALSPEVKMKLKELIDKEIDVNEMTLGALAVRETEIARQKMEIVEAQIRQAKNVKRLVKSGAELAKSTERLVKNEGDVGRDVAVVGDLGGASVVSSKSPAQSRHIPVKIRKVLKLEFGSKCADSGCQNRSEHIHHERPFAYYGEHDSRVMKPLCRGHHELEHVG